jgi:hypothetical protein
MPLAYHVGLRRQDIGVLAQDRSQLVRLVRSVLTLGPRFGLVVFGFGDHHLHLKTMADQSAACELARRLALSFGRLLGVSTGIVRSFINTPAPSRSSCSASAHGRSRARSCWNRGATGPAAARHARSCGAARSGWVWRSSARGTTRGRCRGGRWPNPGEALLSARYRADDAEQASTLASSQSRARERDSGAACASLSFRRAVRRRREAPARADESLGGCWPETLSWRAQSSSSRTVASVRGSGSWTSP